MVSVECAIHMRIQREISIHSKAHDIIGEFLGEWKETLRYGISIGRIVAIFGVACAIHGIGVLFHAIALEVVCKPSEEIVDECTRCNQYGWLLTGTFDVLALVQILIKLGCLHHWLAFNKF